MVASRKTGLRVRNRRLPVGLTVLAVVLLLVSAGCGGGEEGSETEATPGVTDETPGAAGTAPGEANAAPGAADTDQEPLPRLVDLGADKCVPCKMMAPILEELKETYAGQLEVEFIDVWKDPAPGREYGVKVIPTQVFFDEQGNELFRHQGFMSGEDIMAKWAELGYEFDS